MKQIEKGQTIASLRSLKGCLTRSSLILVQMLAQNFVHFKHVNLVNAENSLKIDIAHNLALVFWVLQFVSFNIDPELLYDLRSREFVDLQHGS